MWETAPAAAWCSAVPAICWSESVKGSASGSGKAMRQRCAVSIVQFNPHYPNQPRTFTISSLLTRHRIARLCQRAAVRGRRDRARLPLTAGPTAAADDAGEQQSQDGGRCDGRHHDDQHDGQWGCEWGCSCFQSDDRVGYDGLIRKQFDSLFLVEHKLSWRRFHPVNIACLNINFSRS